MIYGQCTAWGLFASETFCELVNFWGRTITCDLIFAKLNCVILLKDLVPFLCQSEHFDCESDFLKSFFYKENKFAAIFFFWNFNKLYIWKFRRACIKLNDFKKFLRRDFKARESFKLKGTQYLCAVNKHRFVHDFFVEKGAAWKSHGYSIQLAEWERGNRGELFAPEPAPSRALRRPVPHLGITTAWPRCPRK